LGPDLRFVETDQDVVPLNHVAFPDAQLRHDAAFEMLNGLAVRFDGDDAGRHQRPFERDNRRPGAETANHDDEDNKPHDDVGPAVGLDCQSSRITTYTHQSAVPLPPAFTTVNRDGAG
jgi:hypothetical protein